MSSEKSGKAPRSKKAKPGVKPERFPGVEKEVDVYSDLDMRMMAFQQIEKNDKKAREYLQKLKNAIPPIKQTPVQTDDGNAVSDKTEPVVAPLVGKEEDASGPGNNAAGGDEPRHFDAFDGDKPRHSETNKGKEFCLKNMIGEGEPSLCDVVVEPGTKDIIKKSKPCTKDIIEKSKPGTKDVIEKSKPSTKDIVDHDKPGTKEVVRAPLRSKNESVTAHDSSKPETPSRLPLEGIPETAAASGFGHRIMFPQLRILSNQQITHVQKIIALIALYKYAITGENPVLIPASTLKSVGGKISFSAISRMGNEPNWPLESITIKSYAGFRGGFEYHFHDKILLPFFSPDELSMIEGLIEKEEIFQSLQFPARSSPIRNTQEKGPDLTNPDKSWSPLLFEQHAAVRDMVRKAMSLYLSGFPLQAYTKGLFETLKTNDESRAVTYWLYARGMGGQIRYPASYLIKMLNDGGPDNEVSIEMVEKKDRILGYSQICVKEIFYWPSFEDLKHIVHLLGISENKEKIPRDIRENVIRAESRKIIKTILDTIERLGVSKSFFENIMSKDREEYSRN